MVHFNRVMRAVVLALVSMTPACYGHMPIVPDETAACPQDTLKSYREGPKPYVETTCATCHPNNGSELNLVPGADEYNVEQLGEFGQVIYDGVPWPLVMMAGGTVFRPHPPGVIYAPGSTEYAAFEAFFADLNMVGEIDFAACQAHDLGEYWGPVEMIGPVATMVRVHREFLGIPPPKEVLDTVRFGDEDDFRAALFEAFSHSELREWVMMVGNDVIHTNRYATNGAKVLAKYYHDFRNDPEFAENKEYRELWWGYANDAVGRQPLYTLWLVYIAGTEGVPFAELVTTACAVSPPSAKFLKINTSIFKNPKNPDEWVFRNPPHEPQGGGVFTCPITGFTHMNTETSHWRHAADFKLRWDYNFHVLGIGDRPEDDADPDLGFNPSRYNPGCTKCHEHHEPVAGLFQNRNFDGYYVGSSGWHGDMFPPGLGNEKVLELPQEEIPRALQWAGEKIRATSELLYRFHRGWVERFFTALTGQEILKRSDDGDPFYDEHMDAFVAQDTYIEELVLRLETNGGNMIDVLAAIAAGPYFRAKNLPSDLDESTRERYAFLGARCTHRPKQMARVYKSLGLNGAKYLDIYTIYGGDDDSVSRLEPLCYPQGFGVSVNLRMAREAACVIVAADFTKPAEERTWFPYVEPLYTPLYLGQFPIPGIIELFEKNLSHIYEMIHGEPMSYEAVIHMIEFMGTFQSVYLDLVAKGEMETAIPNPCRATHDADGNELAVKIVDDPDGILAMWRAIIELMLTDPRLTGAMN